MRRFACDHRNEAVAQQDLDQFHVGVVSRDADAAKINSSSIDAVVRRCNIDQTDAPISARQADRTYTGGVQHGTHARVDRARHDRDDHVERRLVCYPKPIDLSLWYAAALQRCIDFSAASVHHDEVRADGDAPDRLRERRDPHWVFEKFSTEL